MKNENNIIPKAETGTNPIIFQNYDVVIIGAGPAGLACARVCAEAGATVAVFERRKQIGEKVCAGGITMHGILDRFKDIVQRTFPAQTIVTRHQRAEIHAKEAIIATLNRVELGERMALEACRAGANIFVGAQVQEINAGSVTVCVKNKLGEEKERQVHYTCLVGADGSNSRVRRFLGLPVELKGFGINCQLPITREKMEWHLNPSLFASGYAWIFPHRETTSIGVYGDSEMISARELCKNFQTWTQAEGFDLEGQQLRAENINFDYRGVEFKKDSRIYLVGDAAGLASGLTGEGIYSAVISGEYVGNRIINPSWENEIFTRLEARHARHLKAVRYARTYPKRLSLLSEGTCLLLRLGLLPINKAEMGG
ncbi:NAD(P)/FAD-dependent oxidoreductase [Desulforhopalus vacuolatus]|uniref:NAD(P)/FAD-dependent oxidoreductase n=1 Tax=Desulforhopalus vacuolatus TaxID=40414 RepID=UPI0019626000|nr:NAD(P)/FAD-dependent oxidoreductase [Desulforhopalus vacuolatus]MBM9520089.1 NAD(P)/FAD-dependent oxidoreductase [Desulforhopalus vacuolatus]